MRAALLAELKAPFVVEEVELLDPTPGRVVVRTGATPFCSTDCINQRGERGRSRRRSSDTPRSASSGRSARA
jgi:S-(hydroxymethyl)glutathione dehydrogenase/alcohol dehydrogenase